MKITIIIKNLTVIIFALFAINLYSQNEGFHCEIENENRSWPTDGTILQYIPDEYTTTKYVRVNFHFMLKADSTLNFRPYDDGLGNTSFTGYDYANTIVNKVNQRLATNEQMHLPQGNSTPCMDRKYRIVLKGVYFHYDDNAYSYYRQYTGYMDNVELAYYSINPTTEINIFFLYDDDPNWNGSTGGRANMGGNRWVRMKAFWQQYRDNLNQLSSVFWGTSCTLLHEIGHNLGLQHTMLTGDGYCCDTCDDGLSDTPTIPEITGMGYPNPCPGWGDEGPNYSNNAMDYSGLVAMTPQQLGVIHYTLTHDMLNYLEDNYCHINNMDDCVITDSADLTWQNDRIMMSHLIIESGSKLTLKDCWLHMPSDARIIIKPGGKLIVDGANITNKCNNMWQGIEVWGNSSDHQQYVNGGYLQGYLELRNGATIENAICAVELWHPNHNNTTGGIIFAKDAVFRNNRKAVHAKDYTNFYPTSGGEAPYNAIFRHCDFIIDDDYLETETFYKHVDIANVNGIKFQGCEFSVSSNSNGASPWCVGIGAYSAGFTVDSYCENIAINPCPDNSLYRSTFTGFNNGILSVNEGNSAKTFSVRDAVFTNNHRGIFAHNTGYVTILNNEFNIGCNLECGYGVYAVGVTGFCIEENVFRPVIGSSCTTYGIGIFKSGSINDIYKNNFEYLTFGNVSVGVNYSDNNDGLTYTCNENIGNGIDFCVLNEGNVGGVRSQQGSASSPAGNTFSGTQYHFYNGTDSRMQYYYNSGNMNETPDVLKLNSITPIPTTYSNSCLSHYGSGGVIKSPKEKAALAEIYKTSEDAHERYMAAGDIVRSDLNDSVANPEELRLWLGNMNEIAADRMIVASYIQEGDFKNAFALANTLPDIYQLKGDDLDDHNDYMAIVSLYQKLYNTDRTVREMTDDEKKMVEDIADNGIGTSQLMARGIMMEIGDRYIEPYVCPDMPRDSGGRGEMIHNNYEYEENNVFAVKLSPIPATTWVSVDYQLPEKATKATMTVMSPLGNVVMDIEFSGNKGAKALDLRDLPNGVYTYIVKCGDVVKSGKLVVMK